MRSSAILILGILLTAFSVQALADPPGQERMQMIISAPLYGSLYRCSFLNLTDEEIEIFLTIDDELDGPVDWNTIVPAWATGVAGDDSPSEPAFCKIEWMGKPGDIKASHCLVWGPNDWGACVTLD